MRKKQQKQSRRGREERKRSPGQGRAGERAPAAGSCSDPPHIHLHSLMLLYHLGDVSFLFPFLKTVNDDWIPTVRYGLFFICFSCRLKRGNYNYEKRAGVGVATPKSPEITFLLVFFQALGEQTILHP